MMKYHLLLSLSSQIIPLCKNVLSNIQSAHNHISRSLKEGRCTATRTFNGEAEKAKSSNGNLPNGQPHYHAWIALLEALYTQATEQEKETYTATALLLWHAVRMSAG
jgi:hypothetical protein